MNILFESVYEGLVDGSFNAHDYVTEGATWQTIKIVMG